MEWAEDGAEDEELVKEVRGDEGVAAGVDS